MDDAGEILGAALCRVTEAEFIAAHRAARIARNRLYDFAGARILLAAVGHLLLLSGALFLLVQLRDGVTSWPLVGLSLFWAATGLWLVDRWIYGYRRRHRKLHRAHPLAGLDVERTFTPNRLLTRASNMDGSIDWRLIARVVELRDGFFLEVQPLNGIWIPGHSPRPPLGAEALAALLRSKVKNYAVIDRRARLREED